MHLILTSPNKKINWSEAKDIVIRSYANFDKSFEDIVLLFFNNSWIDAELKSGKSPGAFCSFYNSFNTPLHFDKLPR